MNTADPARPRGRILLVEDDADAAYYIMRVLTTMGYFDVVHLLDPAVALRRAVAEPWDLVLTDVDLPGMSGLDLLRALRREVPALPVAVVTARVPSVAADALRLGAGAYLEKPVPAAHLVAVTAALIAGPAAKPLA